MAKQPADNPMIAMLMKSIGIDPGTVMGQAKQLGDAFQQLLAGQAQLLIGQAEIIAALREQTDMLWTLQMALNVVPDRQPSDETLKLIADESRKFLEDVGETVT